MQTTRKLSPSVVMALELDDASVVRTFEAQGFQLLDLGRITGQRPAWAWFVGELEARASDQWDLPFGIRMACLKLARAIHRDLSAEV